MAIYNCKQFGAVGDSIMNDMRSLQAAIDHCHEQGGGTVLVPPGRYLTGSLLMRSYVNLHLAPSAELYASMEERDYRLQEAGGASALLVARQAKRVSVTGNGTINGRGDEYLEPDTGEGEYPLAPLGSFRPRLIDWEGCEDVLFRDVTLLRAPFWCLHLTGCERVTIDGITILGQLRGPNNDGIDPDSCKSVHISNCHIEAGDDCIVLKTTEQAAARYGACEDVTVTGCTLVSRSAAIKIGTETFGDIRRVVVQNCVIRDSNRGIGIWVRDGGTVEKVMLSHLIIETRLFGGKDEETNGRPYRWWGKGEPIFMSVARRSDSSASFPGVIRDIAIRDVMAESESCIFLEGAEDSPLQNIELSGVRTRMVRKSGYSGGLFDTQPSAHGLREHPIPAIYCKQVRRCKLRQVEIEWSSERRDWSHGLHAEDVEGLQLVELTGDAHDDRHAFTRLERVTDPQIRSAEG